MAKANGREAESGSKNYTDPLQSNDRIPPRKLNSDIPHILPHEKVFPIQIGSELFRLSGASISSDGDYLAFPLPLHFRSWSYGFITVLPGNQS